jgi:sugar phosphate isomerase/epimerase
MDVQRFLGAAWASVHGPSDPRRLLISVLEAGFQGLAVSNAPRPLDWSALRAAAADLPVDFPAVRVGNPLADRSPTAGLAAAKDGERDAARSAVQQAVGLARLVGCPRVVLDVGVVPVFGDLDAEDLGDPQTVWTKERTQALVARRNTGRIAALERLCRALFELIKSFPDIDFCLTQSRSVRALLDVEALRLVVEDLSSRRFGYWHDAALCARRQQVLGEAQGEWLEAFGNRLRGMSLGDASEEGLYLPPGSGGVDYALLASYVPRTGGPLPVVLELDASVPPGELAGMRSCLDKHGL